MRPSLFEEVLSGSVPGTDIDLVRMREGLFEHRPSWDITCLDAEAGVAGGAGGSSTAA